MDIDLLVTYPSKNIMSLKKLSIFIKCVIVTVRIEKNSLRVEMEQLK